MKEWLRWCVHRPLQVEYRRRTWRWLIGGLLGSVWLAEKRGGQATEDFDKRALYVMWMTYRV